MIWIMSVGISIFAFLLGVTLLIGFHEFGHFWVARRCGVKVRRFSIGFGRALFSWRRGGVEYRLGMIPLGGYVQMLGEADSELVEPEDRKRAFNRQPLAARAAIISAGPAFNFILALVLYAFAFMIGQVDMKPIVHEVLPNTPAEVAGINAGDEILAADGDRIDGWRQLIMAVIKAGIGGEGGSEFLLRDPVGGERTAFVDLSGLDFLDRGDMDIEREVGVYPWQPPAVVRGIAPDAPVADSGLRPGDRFVSLEQQTVSAWRDFVSIVQARPNQRVTAVVERDGALEELILILGEVGRGGRRIGYAGITPRMEPGDIRQNSTVVRDLPGAALVRAAETVVDMSGLTLKVLWGLLTGEASLTNISGPVSIARYAGATFMSGVTPYLTLLALLSLSIGIVNLLPVPMLDGGQLVYCMIEFFKGSPVSESAQWFGQRLGILIIAGLITIALYSDLSRLLG